ncbi:ABC transporter substrate-binding protein [Litorihabitans aurantiacus]|nr:ABC transporter substrate-binding protein [Litorihabitans aurantiacus]
MHRTRTRLLAAIAAVGALALGACAGSDASTSAGGGAADGGTSTVRINQAFQSLLYLPLYVAEDQGFFEQEGIDVEIATGGGGTQSWSAVLGGSAEFSIQDPVFVPKAREAGGEGVVVAGIQNAPTVFILGSDPAPLQDDLELLNGKRVVVSPQPDTTWALMTLMIEEHGLEDVTLVNVPIGNELAAVASGQADYALAVEPQISQGESEGLNVVYSFSEDPSRSPFAFSSLTGLPSWIEENPEAALGTVTAFQRASTAIYADPEAAVATAEKYFPDLDPATVEAAVMRMIEAKGYPEDVLVTQEAWDNNLEIALLVENVQAYPSDATSYENNVDVELAQAAHAAIAEQD